MTANEDQALEALKARRREKRWRIHLSYSFVLLILMIGLGTAAGIVGYEFGREALRGVKPSPPSVKLPTIAPEAPPPPTPPPTKRTQSFWREQNQANFIYEQHYQTRLEEVRARIRQSTQERTQIRRQTAIELPPLREIE